MDIEEAVKNILKRLSTIENSISKLSTNVKNSGPVCNCKPSEDLKKSGWKLKMKWTCPKHGDQVLC